MRPCTEAARQLGVPVYLEATDAAVPMYEKLKFEKLAKDIQLGSYITHGETLVAPVMILNP